MKLDIADIQGLFVSFGRLPRDAIDVGVGVAGPDRPFVIQQAVGHHGEGNIGILHHSPPIGVWADIQNLQLMPQEQLMQLAQFVLIVCNLLEIQGPIGDAGKTFGMVESTVLGRTGVCKLHQGHISAMICLHYGSMFLQHGDGDGMVWAGEHHTGIRAGCHALFFSLLFFFLFLIPSTLGVHLRQNLGVFFSIYLDLDFFSRTFFLSPPFSVFFSSFFSFFSTMPRGGRPSPF